MKQALIIFAKNPEIGKVKTRLAATIGNEAALVIYQQLLLHTFTITERLPIDKFVFYSDYIKQEDIWPSEHYSKELQRGLDLGEKMKNAFDAVFQKGYEKIGIIGTDCPGLSAAIIMNSFACLQYNDIVIGPAEDGGYYLLAMNKLHRQLFEGISWSTGNVLDTTIHKCAALQLKYYLLPILNDIDEEKDLQTFKLQRP